jgi:hypothetical protein
MKGGVVKVYWGDILLPGILGTELLEFYYNNFVYLTVIFFILIGVL